MRVRLALMMLLAGCDRKQPTSTLDAPGTRLEAAAIQQGLVVDPTSAMLGGSWARDSDRLCVVDEEKGDQRIGVIVDYGEGQGCSAAGHVRRHGDVLAVELRENCRFDARFEGDRIVFPADVPDACAALCTGRATLAAVQVERLSASASEAHTLRDRDGAPPCPAS